MSDLIDTTEMYLKTVFELEELGITPMRARIAERLGQSGPTVSQTVARMERDRLLFLDDDRVIHLSIEGEAQAKDVMRRHRLAERHLMDVLGLDYALVHEEACRWEHVMSTAVERKIAERLDPPLVDPYGNPIPGLEDLGIDLPMVNEGQEEDARHIRLVDVPLTPGEPVEITVRAIGEVIQSDPEFLGELADQGIVPGAAATVQSDADSLTLTASSSTGITLSPGDAGHLLVARITSLQTEG